MKLPKMLLIGLCVLPTFLLPGQNVKKSTKSKPIILFVCEHGAARSTIAAAYFNKMATERGLNYQAAFRGTDPDTSLTPDTKNGLTQDGFDVHIWKPMLVSNQDITNASQIITFDCTLPDSDSITKRVEQWNGIPPISNDYRIARNAIIEKVKGLITDLSKHKNKR
ncbi:MAG: hypothetical protein HY089_10050 [Ignavibacteriales bacterium]|nr:hypothetical protein [Ignavibacteriales bacterium]